MSHVLCYLCRIWCLIIAPWHGKQNFSSLWSETWSSARTLWLWCQSAPLFPAERGRVVVSLWSGLITLTPIPPASELPLQRVSPCPTHTSAGNKTTVTLSGQFARVCCCCPWARAGRCTKAALSGCWRSREGSDMCSQAATTFSCSVVTFDSRPAA